MTSTQVVVSWFLAFSAVAAGAQTIAVPPAFYHPAPYLKAQPAPTLLTPESAPSYPIALAAPTPEEKARLKAGVAGPRTASKAALTKTGKGQPLQIGFARVLPDGDRPLDLAALSWQAQADGGKAARIVVTSPGAAAVRLGLAMAQTDPDVSVRFKASTGSQPVSGPYPANQVAAAKLFWSPVLEAESATLEIYLPPGIAPSSVKLALPQLSHLVVAGSGLLKAEPESDIGISGSCEMDVVCLGGPAALNQAKAVAKMLFTIAGNTYLCTGTLVNDSIASSTPYFYTASHCINTQAAASTLVTYWFFDATSCGSVAVPAYQTVSAGAMMLGRSTDYDWALLRLNGSPPPTAVFSAWRADAISASQVLFVLHHPMGDLLKFSQARMSGYQTFSDASSFATAKYLLGSTEPGSSGSGLVTLAAGGNFYELRGGLFGGDASCANPNGTDDYSRFDNALPLVAQYLTPGAANPSKKTVVVEYYDPDLDDYFITANQLEIQGLDQGAHPGWVRTGLTFLAYSDPTVAPLGVSPVCRFYALPQFGNSHFYSADPAECAAVAVRFAGSWVYESPALFYIQLPNPATGACPVNTRPVYRFLNATNQIHHRYTAEADDRNCLYYGVNSSVDEPDNCAVTSGQWILEGYGSPPDTVVMCSPTS